jgi:hypothetical protein
MEWRQIGAFINACGRHRNLKENIPKGRYLLNIARESRGDLPTTGNTAVEGRVTDGEYHHI